MKTIFSCFLSSQTNAYGNEWAKWNQRRTNLYAIIGVKAKTNTSGRSEIAGAGEVKILRKLSTATSILARTWTKIFQFWAKRERERWLMVMMLLPQKEGWYRRSRGVDRRRTSSRNYIDLPFLLRARLCVWSLRNWIFETFALFVTGAQALWSCDDIWIEGCESVLANNR